MDDHELIEGVVVGDAGAVVAGYVKLGANGTRRSLASTIKVRTDDGHEVELLDLDTASLDPIVSKRAAWQQLERSPGASACVDDAPAPDVEVELISALVRGGDRIAASGQARTHVLESDGEGGAYREGASRRVSSLAASVVCVGDDCVARVDQQRTKPAQSARAPTRAPRPRKQPTAWRELYTRPRVVWIVPGLVLLFAIIAGIRGVFAGAGAVAMIGATLVLPLASNAIGIPSFREIRSPRARNLALAGGLFWVWFVIAAAGTVGVQLSGERYPWTWSFVYAIGSLAFALWPMWATARRMRLLRLVVEAPVHASPVVDGIWGALDGRATVRTEPCKIDGHPAIAVHGTHTEGDGVSDVVRSALEIDVERDGQRIPVHLGGALWLTAQSYSTVEFSVDVIRDGALVRVVGRAKGGTIAKGGEESLLLFAAAADAEPIELARTLVYWDRLCARFALAGVAIMLVSSVLAALSS